MKPLLRALLVEDSDDDALLVEDALRRGPLDLRLRRVESEAPLRIALRNETWDIIISDYSLPSFTAREVLQVVREEGVEVPIIIISGTVGEEVAVETLKLGATDYLLKQSLTRLVPAVQRAIEMADSQRRHRLAEQQRAALEEQLRQSQKLEALGTMAGGIAHDFNNILTAIIINQEMAVMGTPEGSDVRGLLEEIGKASGRARELVRQILMFGRRERPERRRLTLETVLREALVLARTSLPSSIAIHTELASDTPEVLADLNQLHQIMLNLCTNAGHAMGLAPGRLTVRARRVQFADDDGQRPLELRPGTYAELVVTDTGQGMSERVRRRIFEPFFTTKPPGEGTGLGLSVVHGIVKEHDGAISVQSEVGVGTTFTLYLPAASSTDEPVSPPRVGVIRGNGERVFVVDDEESICSAMHTTLERIGYKVETFLDPRLALSRLRVDPFATDLLLTDYSMPHLTGPELVEQIHALRPRLPALVMSGGEANRQDSLAPTNSFDLLAKPLDIVELSHAVATALAGPDTP